MRYKIFESEKILMADYTMLTVTGAFEVAKGNHEQLVRTAESKVKQTVK